MKAEFEPWLLDCRGTLRPVERFLGLAMNLNSFRTQGLCGTRFSAGNTFRMPRSGLLGSASVFPPQTGLCWPPVQTPPGCLLGRELPEVEAPSVPCVAASSRA